MLFFWVSFLALYSAQAQEAPGIHLPEFEARPYRPLVSSANKLSIDHFRVLIYPHFGGYSIPQGREPSNAGLSVTVTASKGCDVYSASLDPSNNWIQTGEKIATLKEMNISASGLRQLRRANKLAASGAAAFYYKCNSPFVVQRPVPLVSYEYSGDFVAYRDQQRVQIVNIVDPDTYLKGVIPAEMPAAWPVEALKVQAVAARTYAWWSVIAARSNLANYDMDDTVSYQAYLGNANRTANTDEASQATAGLILKHKGVPIKAYFSADNGGYSESAKAAFGVGLKYCIAQPELYNVSRLIRPTEWSKTFTADELQKLLKSSLPSEFKIAAINVTERSESGRVLQLNLVGNSGRVVPISGSQFRFSTQVRSTLFDVTKNVTGFVFSGKGWGHGVGMAQHGALAYFEQFAWTYDQILKFYYPETVLEPQ